MAELIDEDEHAPLVVHEFDETLWLLLSAKLGRVEDAPAFPRPVVLYFASRYLQWEVENGGFAQAAFNIPEWFPLAADGYRELGKESSVQLIDEAINLLPEEHFDHVRKGLFSSTVGEAFEHFESSKLAELDTRIVEKDWSIDAERVEYVRANRNAFRTIA